MRRFIPAVLALSFVACAAKTPAPVPVPPKPAIVALAHPPAVVEKKEVETVRTLDHKLWSISVPSGWDVVNDSEEGVTLNRMDPKTNKQIGSVQVASMKLDADTTPEEFPVMASALAPNLVPDGVNVVDVKRQGGRYEDHNASLTQVLTDAGVFLGMLAMSDETNRVGYTVVVIGPATKQDSQLLSAISRTFVLKTPAPVEQDDTTPEAPAPKK